ncbi:hypothetical protein Lser_V15G37217 [Lactuca serriola]
MATKLQQLRQMISSVPRVVQPILEASPTSHRILRFAPVIAGIEVPKCFKTPSMKLYDGTKDPEEHITQYRERMEIIPILGHLKEACLCKGFGSTLTGSALKWLLTRIIEKITSDLYRVVQYPKEKLMDFVNRFGREALSIPKINMATAVEAFKMGLRKDSPFYEDLVMTPCKRLDEVRCRALRFIRFEEDREIQKRSNPSDQYENPNRKPESSTQRSYKSKPYSKPVHHRVNALKDGGEEEELPKITDYCFSVDVSGVIHVMQDLGDKARWPKRDSKSTTWKDKSKWCAYHEDFCHMTEDCISLRKEINYLLSKGHLKEILMRKRETSKENSQDDHRIRKKPGSPPSDARIINVILGRSNICGPSYFQAKRHTKVSKTKKEDRPQKNTMISIITMTDS